MENLEIKKTSKSILKRWWFWLIVIVIVLAAIGQNKENRENAQPAAAQSENRSSEASKKPPIILPSDQQKLIDIVTTAQAESKHAANDMQRGGAKAKRDQALCLAVTQAAVNWIGKIESIDANSEGKGVLKISLARNIHVETWSNAVSDIIHHTLLEPGSPVFNAASSMKKGQLVVFSGSFFRGDEGDCLAEGSLTLEGKIEEPDFIFKFTALAPYVAPIAASSPNAPPTAAASPAPQTSPTLSVQFASTSQPTAPAPQVSAPGDPRASAQPDEAVPAAMSSSQSSKKGELNTGSDEEFSTFAGSLKTHQAEGADRQLLLNGQPLFQGDDAQWQRPVAKFTLSNGRDAVLVASSGGRGNSCEVLYYFLTLSKGAQPKWTPEFGTCSPGGRYQQAGDTITLTLPALGKMVTSVFDGNHVVEDGKPVAMVESEDPSK
jgi:hypothetical protein